MPLIGDGFHIWRNDRHLIIERSFLFRLAWRSSMTNYIWLFVNWLSTTSMDSSCIYEWPSESTSTSSETFCACQKLLGMASGARCSRRMARSCSIRDIYRINSGLDSSRLSTSFLNTLMSEYLYTNYFPSLTTATGISSSLKELPRTSFVVYIFKLWNDSFYNRIGQS